MSRASENVARLDVAISRQLTKEGIKNVCVTDRKHISQSRHLQTRLLGMCGVLRLDQFHGCLTQRFPPARIDRYFLIEEDQIRGTQSI